MSNNSFYNRKELEALGFVSLGENVLISKKASLYGIDKMSIGNNVRIDDFCILSGRICIGNYIHISAYTGIWAGNSGVYLEDYVTISGRCNIYGKSDDYSGEYMTNPMIPSHLISVQDKTVIFRKHSILGSACTVFPGVELAEGTAVGSMSLVTKSTEAWKMYVGVPIRFLRERKKKILVLENLL